MIGVAGPRAPGPKYGQPVLPNLNVRQLCPNCRADPPNIVEEYSKGDLVCGDCGTILGDRIVDTRSEWRTFAGDEGGDDPSRVGDAGNPLLGPNALDTTIGSRDNSNGIARDLQRAQARANAQSNGRTNTTALSAVFNRISEKCELMQLPRNIIVRAQEVYKKAEEKKVVKGKNDSAVIAACIIYACRLADSGANRSFAEVCKVVKVSKKELGQVFMTIKNAIQADIPQSRAVTASVTQNTVESQLARYSNNLDVGNTVYNAAKHIASAAENRAQISGRSPVSIAAGVLYMACILFGKTLPIKEITSHAEVSESTVKLICKLIAKHLDQVIRPEWREQHAVGYALLAALGRDSTIKKARSETPKAKSEGTPDGLEKIEDGDA